MQYPPGNNTIDGFPCLVQIIEQSGHVSQAVYKQMGSNAEGPVYVYWAEQSFVWHPPEPVKPVDPYILYIGPEFIVWSDGSQTINNNYSPQLDTSSFMDKHHVQKIGQPDYVSPGG